MIIKNHIFIDGNKRIAATLFIYILFFYNILFKDISSIILVIRVANELNDVQDMIYNRDII